MRQLRNMKCFSMSVSWMRAANLGLLALILIPIAVTERLPAGFSPKITRLIVEIDGVNYGSFNPIKDLDRLVGRSKIGEATKVALSRDFVTDPSLYLWANSLMQVNTGLKDVMLISENADGVEVARHVLRLSQPVAWTVEASNPEIGGLHEKVEFAVQKIDRR